MNKAELKTIKIIRGNKPYDVKLKALNEYASEERKEAELTLSMIENLLSQDYKTRNVRISIIANPEIYQGLD